MLRWCAFDTGFPPNQSDIKFQEWTLKGLTSYLTFNHEGELADFQTLKAKRSLNNQDFFRYLQMRNRYNEIVEPSREEKGNRILNTFQMAYNVNTVVRKIVAKLYQGYQENKPTYQYFVC